MKGLGIKDAASCSNTIRSLHTHTSNFTQLTDIQATSPPFSRHIPNSVKQYTGFNKEFLTSQISYNF